MVHQRYTAHWAESRFGRSPIILKISLAGLVRFGAFSTGDALARMAGLRLVPDIRCWRRLPIEMIESFELGRLPNAARNCCLFKPGKSSCGQWGRPFARITRSDRRRGAPISWVFAERAAMKISANALIAHRQRFDPTQPVPVVLKPADWPAWLGETPADVPYLKAMLTP